MKLDGFFSSEGENNLPLADFVKHHEWNEVLFLFRAVVNHIHVDDVVLNDDVTAVRNIGRGLLSPDLDSARVLSPFIRLPLASFVLETQLEDDFEDSSADVEVSKIPDHQFELGLLADF